MTDLLTLSEAAKNFAEALLILSLAVANLAGSLRLQSKKATSKKKGKKHSKK